MKKTTLVLGASLKADRYSNRAIIKLVENKHDVAAIGLKEGEVAGVLLKKGFPVFEDIETVTLYLNPERQKAYYNYIINLMPRRVVFNPGTENEEFMDLLTKNNIDFDVACTLVLLATNQY